jgi:non-ribosomal peptide synthetase component F
MVDFGSGQDRSDFETAGVVVLRRGFQKSENAGRGRKMPFMDGHYLTLDAIKEGAMLNLTAVLEHSATELPDKTAIVLGDQRFSYTQINAAANQVANGLTAAGITRGDKVALSCPNLPYFPMIYFGILKTGAAVVPLPEQGGRGERSRRDRDPRA